MIKLTFFKSKDCLACIEVLPIIKKFKGVKIVDVDKKAGLEKADKKGIKSLPTLVVEKDSKERWIVGSHTEQEYTEKIKNI